LFGLNHCRRFIILTYHRVVSEPDSLRPSQIDSVSFARQMEVLRRYFNVLSLSKAHSHLQDDSLPPRSVVITFDDGYADNVHIALPILKRFGLPATFFIATGYLNGGRMWNDTIIEAIRRTPLNHADLDFLGIDRLSLDDLDCRRKAIMEVIQSVKYLPVQERILNADKVASILMAHSLPTDMMLTDDELRALHSQGMEIGGHTVNHPILTQLSLDETRKEIMHGRDSLAECLGVGIDSFAYPNGRPGKDYQASHVAVVRELGFEVAVSTAWGPVRSSDDAWQLPRVGFTEFRKMHLFLQMLRSYSDPQAARV